MLLVSPCESLDFLDPGGLAQPGAPENPKTYSLSHLKYCLLTRVTIGVLTGRHIIQAVLGRSEACSVSEKPEQKERRERMRLKQYIKE